MRRFPLSIRVNSREISPWDSESVKEKVPRSIFVYTYRKGMESEQGECHIYSTCICKLRFFIFDGIFMYKNHAEAVSIN